MVNRPNAHDEDIDDIMASIMGGQSKSTPPPDHRSQKKQTNRKNTKRQKTAIPEPGNPRKKSKFLKYTVLLLSITALCVAIFMLAKGPMEGLLKPKSPFSQELSEKMGISLYYPTSMPDGFKLETNSISQPEQDVIVYAITDDGLKKINISLQKKPEGLNLEPLFNVLSNNRQINTKYGAVKIGTSDEGTDIANVIMGETWIIISFARGTISDPDLQKLIDSLTE